MESLHLYQHAPPLKSLQRLTISTNTLVRNSLKLTDS